MFVAGYVRSQINLQERLWIYYLLCLYLPVLLCYLLLLIPDSHISAIYHRQKKRRQTSSSSFARKDSAKSVTKLSNKKSPALSLSEEVFLPSLEIIFIIGIYMMIFSILSGMLTSFPLFQVPVFTFVLANLEVTTGIHLLALKPFITPQIQYALIAAATSFGGLCTMAQVQTVLSATDLSLKRYIVIKTGTAFVSFLLCLILLC